MSEPIEVESLVRIDLKPGEMLAIVAPQAATRADMAEMDENLRSFLYHTDLDWTYAIFPYGTRFEAVRGVQESCRCDKHTHGGKPTGDAVQKVIEKHNQRLMRRLRGDDE